MARRAGADVTATGAQDLRHRSGEIMPKDISGRHVSEVRRLLIKHTERLLLPLGWSINARSMNASFSLGPRRLIIKFKEWSTTLTPDISKSRTIRPEELKTLSDLHAEAFRTHPMALALVKDLHELLHVDHLRAMAVIAEMREIESNPDGF